ncbi:MAG: 5,10-methylenetetrahydromethanopterin reductase [Halobacteriaceae archaeon]
MHGIELTPEIPVERVAALAERAEAAGFDAVLTSSHYNNRDPVVTLDRVAAATDGVRLGPGVANPYDTHPVRLASQVATLDEVSDGRAILGLGAGDRSTLRNLGVDRDRPLRRVLETMRVARRLWAGERVDHDGTFAAVDAGLNYPARRVPVYVGAQGPDMVRMAAKHADGVLYNAAHPDDVAWAADRVAEGRAARPADRAAPEFVAFASVSVATDDAAAREAARPPVAFIAAGAARPVLDRHGVDPDRAAAVGAAIEAGAFSEAFDLVTDRMLDAFCVAGTVETVAADLGRILAYADGVVVGSPLGPDRERAITLAADALDRAGRA